MSTVQQRLAPLSGADGTTNGWATRVTLQPIAAPSALGLAASRWRPCMVATIQAKWWGSPADFKGVAPFCLTFGGIAQFLAGMWAYKARDIVATIAHGMWGAFWIAFFVLQLLQANGTVPTPGPRRARPRVRDVDGRARVRRLDVRAWCDAREWRGVRRARQPRGRGVAFCGRTNLGRLRVRLDDCRRLGIRRLRRTRVVHGHRDGAAWHRRQVDPADVPAHDAAGIEDATDRASVGRARRQARAVVLGAGR